nr:putative ribonuclease H-like domain-containing protein [Tanacetum cinerariifolium]
MFGFWFTILQGFKNKKDERGIVIRNKERLVAQGHTQDEGIDYEEVFALVARIDAIRLFLTYASYIGFTVYQMDVKSAFLYGTIDEEVYVMQPPGFQDPEFPHRVYKVEKAMYGLHQALRAWYGTFSKYLVDNGFQRGTSSTNISGTKEDVHQVMKEKESPLRFIALSNWLEDFFGDTSDVVSLNDVEAYLSNMETAIQVSPTHTLRIHKDHPKSQMIGPIDTPVQTRQKTKNVDKQSFIA